MHSLKIACLALILAACSPIRGCVESNFELAPDSRLPAWFRLGSNVSRADVTVDLFYWTSGDAEFDLKDLRSSKTIGHVIGRSCWHPATRYTRKSDGTLMAPEGPLYKIATIGGVVDVMEHTRLNNVFRMASDPSIIDEARQSISRGICRREPDG